MQVTDCTAKNALSDISDPEAVIHSLQAALEAAQTEIAALKQQLDWFKRQLFGRKSEKRIIEHPDQLDLSALLGDTPPPTEPEPTEEITYRRRKPKQRNADDVTDTGLRFGPDVPIEVIELSAPQLEGPEADQYEVIDHKISRRLAQRPGSYVVLEYRRPVLRHKPSASLMEVPAPSAVFEGSLAGQATAPALPAFPPSLAAMLASWRVFWWTSSATTCPCTANISVSRMPGSP